MGLLERDGLLEQLDGLLGEAAKGRGRLVIVRGEAGIGKSALVEAFVAGRAGPVVWGMCDPVLPPRPLAPLFDIAAQVDGELLAALGDPERHRILAAFLALLRAGGGPRIVVFEDVQWADEATLEVLQVVGRRALQLPALIVVTVRDDEVGPDHPLSVALGDIPPGSTVSMLLPPLSLDAVAQLAANTGLDPNVLHAATAGNPFFVTEAIAAGRTDVPSTVRDAVWARVRRLPSGAKSAVRAAAVLGPRSDISVLCALVGEAPEAVDACIAGGILQRHASSVEFRHELARRAVLAAVAPSEQCHLHRRALDALREHVPVAEPAELARHAVGAGDPEAVLDLAPKAAAQAAALGAHRAALAHYESALPYTDHLPERQRATLLSGHAHECFVTDETGRAIVSQQEAVRYLWRAGDVSAEGRALTELAEYLWWNAETDRAQEAATEAVRLLESSPAEPAVALAYAGLAQVKMLSADYAVASEWGAEAVALGRQFGEVHVVAHALNTLGTSELSLGEPDGWAKVETSLRLSSDAGLEEDTARAWNNLIALSREHKLYDRFDRYREQAAIFFDEHDLDASQLCLVGDVVEGLFDRGQWSEAAGQATAVVERGSVHGRPQCLAVLGRIAARRGDGDPFLWLDEALELQASLGGEVVYPLRSARAEAAWLGGDARRAAQELQLGLPGIEKCTNAWAVGEFGLWARRLGIDWDCPKRPADPYVFLLEGHPDKAAAAWATIGCPYEQAEALAESDDAAQARRALSIFQSLHAGPQARRISERLRTMGVRRIARGPRTSTKANPAGLTDREVEILVLLADGLRNAEIAERLVLSTRTVDHHVSAVLRKLGARSRRDAASAAVRFGVASTPRRRA